MPPRNAGLSVDSTGNNVTIDLSKINLTACGLTPGCYLTKNTFSGAIGKKMLYMGPVDRYGKLDGNLDSITQTSVSPAGEFSVDSTGLISGTPVAGQVVTITGTANGFGKTINIIFK